MNYYNEIDKLMAEVLREAIKAGAIAKGDVDERSIVDVRGSDLTGYTQCHFFAGGGFWSLSLRSAGWGDDREVWTGSCPCPSFSAAGKGGGFRDARHLWPDWVRLIRECRPAVLFGEQVGAAIGHGWLDLVQTDLEKEAYSVGSIVFGAAGVGAPHIRQRLYFCADTEPALGWPESAGKQGRATDGRDRPVGDGSDTDGWQSCDGDVQRGGEHGLLVQDRGAGFGHDTPQRGLGIDWSAPGSSGHPTLSCEAFSGDDSERARLQGLAGDERKWRGPGWLDPEQARSIAATGATRGWWRDCDWWSGRDGKYRPIGPGLQPLAHGSPARVGRLRLYGDGIVVPAATEFIKAYKETRGLK